MLGLIRGSPHVRTIRERMSLGRSGNYVSAKTLRNLFYDVKRIIDESVKSENGLLTHFEVFTALAFALFSREKVDIAVIEAGLGGMRDATNVLSSRNLTAAVITTIGEEHLAALGGSLESIALAKSGIIKSNCPVVIGGPFDPHIENIIRGRASALDSPVVSGCDPGVHGVIKSFGTVDCRPCQSCNIHINIERDLRLSGDFSDVNLRMLGHHQLQNAITATCTALCLRNQGWAIPAKSIQEGLEKTELPGRGQFLTSAAIEGLGLSGVSVLLDGAHTEASAKALADMVNAVAPNRHLALVVAMASDKNHLKFASQLLSGLRPELVVLTEASIAGSSSRTASALSLKDAWVDAAAGLGLGFKPIGPNEKINPGGPTAFVSCLGLPMASLRLANELLPNGPVDIGLGRLIVVTGSLHIVSHFLPSA
ncbi:folylpolyglutamate synthetase family protein isoform X2 [Wolffia australiana]